MRQHTKHIQNHISLLHIYSAKCLSVILLILTSLLFICICIYIDKLKEIFLIYYVSNHLKLLPPIASQINFVVQYLFPYFIVCFSVRRSLKRMSTHNYQTHTICKTIKILGLHWNHLFRAQYIRCAVCTLFFRSSFVLFQYESNFWLAA